MSRRKRKSRVAGPAREPAKISGRKTLLNYLLAFAFGAVTAGGAAMLIVWADPHDAAPDSPGATHSRSPAVGRRSVAGLMALSDAELEQVDIVEMNVVVAQGIPGLEKLDYEHYRQIVDGWSDEFRRWLPTVKHVYHERPDHFHGDINFFRLGMLAQFLDERVGIAYVEEQKQAAIEARKSGKKGEVLYTDPGHLLLHGLIDAKRGTCGTMSTLHVAIGRRLGWPVALACADSHYVCRYDDGKVVYNIEATDTGRQRRARRIPSNQGENTNETRNRKGTIMKRTTTLTLLALACLTALPSIAQARYVDGMNVYEYVRSSPTGFFDSGGAQATRPAATGSPPRPTETDWREKHPEARDFSQAYFMWAKAVGGKVSETKPKGPDYSLHHWIEITTRTAKHAHWTAHTQSLAVRTIAGKWLRSSWHYHRLEPCTVLVDLAHSSSMSKSPMRVDPGTHSRYFALTCYGDVHNRTRCTSSGAGAVDRPNVGSFTGETPRIRAPVGPGRRGIEPEEKWRKWLADSVHIPKQKQRDY